MDLSKITVKQREIYKELQDTGVFYAYSKYDRNSCEALVGHGYATCLRKESDSWVYGLIDVPKKAEEKSEAPINKVAERAAQRLLERMMQPDSPKPPMKRPPAVYSNGITGDALIDQILGPSKKSYGK